VRSLRAGAGGRCEKVPTVFVGGSNNFAGGITICDTTKAYFMTEVIRPMAMAEEAIISKIYLVRGCKVVIDRDLSELYGVETKVLKQAVRRNINRFPSDFLFEMTSDELEDWRSQFVTSKEDRLGLRHPPFCFTEQGVTMLSCVLNSERAIAVNIQVIRVF
jgi:hypothetical protein